MGVWGDAFMASSVFVSLLLAFIFPVVLALVLGKERTIQQYFKRIPEIPIVETETMTCFVTGETEHKSDFVLCPFHGDNWISSKACATETKCNKVCQINSVTNTVPVDQSV